MNNTMLKVSNLKVSYGSITAIKGISLEVKRGVISAILGANDAGKTTTMRAISRLLKPSEGSIEFKGVELTVIPAHKVVSLGISQAPEEPYLISSPFWKT